MIQKSNGNRWPYYLLLASLVSLLAWLVMMETRGAAMLMATYPGDTTVQGAAASTLPYVVYPSIVIVILIIFAALFRKRWGYLVGIAFGTIHVLLAASIVVMGMSPISYGPFVVMTISGLIVLFSVLAYRAEQIDATAPRPA